MSGVRISVKMPLQYPFLFEKNYKKAISSKLIESGLNNFSFSDLICRKKKIVEDGFYGLSEARFDIITIYNKNIYKIMKCISQEGINFRNGRLKNLNFEINRIEYFSEGYFLSPILVLDDEGNSIDFVNQPVIYSQSVRKKLINKYIKLFNSYPMDDNFVIIYRNLVNRIIDGERIYIKSKFELFGSEELINLANMIGLGDNTEEGFGMVSNSLYFYKNQS